MDSFRQSEPRTKNSCSPVMSSQMTHLDSKNLCSGWIQDLFLTTTVCLSDVRL